MFDERAASRMVMASLRGALFLARLEGRQRVRVSSSFEAGRSRPYHRTVGLAPVDGAEPKSRNTTGFSDEKVVSIDRLFSVNGKDAAGS
jgi:hypothetical protein